MTTTEMLPRAPEELTAEWLSGALGRTVSELAVENILWGTATKVLVRATYADEPGPEGPPSALCIKGGFQESIRAFGMAAAYAIEAKFYERLAPAIELRLPRSWYAGIDEENEQGIIVLDDLSAAGASFGEPTEPWNPDLTAGALEQLAALHGPTWGAATGSHVDWLGVGAAAVRGVAPALLSAEHWETHFQTEGIPELPQPLQDRERAIRGMHRLWELDDAATHCATHGDAHLGNTFVDRDGAPGFLDWQTPCRAPGFFDVGYFIAGALDPQTRRAREHDLVRHYLAALKAAGGPELSFDEAWLDYRRHAFHGFFWAVTPPVMQTVERVAAMSSRYCAAIEELDSFDALGV
jgi:hypothetical protein